MSPIAPVTARPGLGPWLWALILLKAVWLPILELQYWLRYVGRHIPDGFAYLWMAQSYRFCSDILSTAIMVIAAALLWRCRRQLSVHVMIFALWLPAPLFAARYWVLGIRDFSWHGQAIFAANVVASFLVPLPWIGYLLETPEVRCLYPRRSDSAQMTELNEVAAAHATVVSIEGQTTRPGLGPWLSLLIMRFALWDPIDLTIRIAVDHTGQSLGEILVALTSWRHATVIAVVLVQIAGAILLLCRRRWSSVLLLISILWLEPLIHGFIEAGHGLFWTLQSYGTTQLIGDAGFLLWPLPYTAYLLNSARVARLYPRQRDRLEKQRALDAF